MADKVFITDGGIETTLIFKEGLELPDFAAFYLLREQAGQQALERYFRSYAILARDFEAGLILESATWRANPDWATKLGYSEASLAGVDRQAIEMLEELRREFESQETPVVISGCVGPRGDGYNPTNLMSAAEAEQYHAPQIQTFSRTQADMVTAITMNYPDEAIGIVRAARNAGMPVAISFTVETDGKLPTGQSLKEAIEYVDESTDNGPEYYMINCAHPTHFANVLKVEDVWTERIRGLRANASAKSHAELNESVELDEGNPEELGRQYQSLMKKLRNLRVLGGCCGTDVRHIEAVCEACLG